MEDAEYERNCEKKHLVFNSTVDNFNRASDMAILNISNGKRSTRLRQARSNTNKNKTNGKNKNKQILQIYNIKDDDNYEEGDRDTEDKSRPPENQLNLTLIQEKAKINAVKDQG